MLDFDESFELKSKFDDMLDECYPVYKMGELTFYPSQILRECDPIAYRVALADIESDLTQYDEEDEDE